MEPYQGGGKEVVPDQKSKSKNKNKNNKLN
jgi:hypothetical protein